MASNTSPKDSAKQLSIDKNNANLEVFVKFFVEEFEKKLTAYRMILEGEGNGRNKASNTLAEAVGEAAGGLVGGIVGYFIGAMGTGSASGRSIGQKLGSKVGNQMHMNKVVKLTDLVDLFLKDKPTFRLKLVETGFEIYQSFEMQFGRVTTEQGYRNAYKLLARDALYRALHYLNQNIDASILEGIIYGESKKDTCLGLPIPKPKTPGFKIIYECKGHNEDWWTSSLYEKVGLVIEGKDSTETVTYYERKDGKSRTEKYGYRRLFKSESWEKLKEDYVTSKVEKSEKFTGYEYILKSEDSEEKINAILNKIHEDDCTFGKNRLTAIMKEVKGEIKKVLPVLNEKIAQTEEDRKILERIEARVRNLNVDDFFKYFEQYSKQAREERLTIAKSIEASKEENAKNFDQLNKKQDVHHDDNKRGHEKTQDMLQSVKQRMDCNSKQMDEIREMFEPKGNLKKMSILYDVKLPVQQFTGRKEELSDIHSKIKRSSAKQAVISQMTSISGLGGIGKTELARKYVQEYGKDYEDVIWINAENKDTCRESFMRLAKDHLGIKSKNADGEEKYIKSVVHEVYKYFDNRTSLFVFDNAEVDDYLHEFLPVNSTKADAKIPYILFTSRNREWEKGIEVILLNELKPEDAMAFVKNGLSIEDGSQDMEVKQLVEKLQYFPLAMQQAISYIEDQMKTGKYGIVDYLKELETKSEILLKSEVFRGIDNDYTKTTFTTWNIILEKIKNDDEVGQLAVKILNFMAYLSPEKIKRTIFLILANGNEKLLASAIRLLVKYSMVNGNEDQSILSIHRLVQEIIRLQFKGKEEEEILREVLRLFRMNIGEDILEHTNTALQNPLRKHKELKEELETVHHLALFFQNFKSNSAFDILDLPDKLKMNLQNLAKNNPPKVKQKREYKTIFLCWKGNLIDMEELFGINMNVGEIKMEHEWRFDPFVEDKGVNGINPEVLKQGNRGVVTFQILSKGSAIYESENYENEADLNVRDTYGNTLLHLAAKNGDLRRIKFLINEKGADIEAKNHFGQSPLHFAAANGHLDVVEYLLDEKNARFDDPDYYHFTPLYLAVWNGEINVVKCLVDGKRAKMDYFDGTAFLDDKNIETTQINCTQEWLSCLQELFTTTSMHLAALRGHLDILRYFIDEKGADSNARNIFGSTPLHSASMNGHLETVKYLVDEKGGNVNDRNAFHSTPVHLAALNGHLDTLKYLIDKKMADCTTENQLSISPVHLAAENGHLDVLKYLIEDHKTPHDVHDFERNTPLHLAALNGHLEIVEYLIDHKNADFNLKNTKFDTALHLAAFNGHLAAVKYLIDKKKADFHSTNLTCNSPLHLAATNGHLDLVKYLIDEKKADFHSTNLICNAPLQIAATNGHLDLVKYLIDEKHVDFQIKNSKGDTPLLLAASNGHLAIVKFLIDDKDADFNITNSENDTPLQVAAWIGDLDSLKYLIDDKKANLNITNVDGDTLLHIAAANGDIDIVKYLIGDKKVDLEIKNSRGNTPLHLASLNGHLAIVKYLIDEKKADFKLMNDEGNTPLQEAAWNGHLDIVKYLIDIKNTVFNFPNAMDNSPLKLAVLNGHLDIVKYLIDEKKADLNITDVEGNTLLHRAAFTGKLDVIQYLIEEKSADFKIRNKDGSSPLHLAAIEGHLDVVKYLIDEKHANANVTDNDRFTPLHIAASKGHLDVVKYLIDENADFKIANENGYSPLHSAAANGHLCVVKYLIEVKHADVTVEDSMGNTPLHAASVSGKVKIVEYLLQSSGEILDRKNQKGETALHLAVMFGREEIKKLLLGNKANPNIKDNYGRTPADLTYSQFLLDLFFNAMGSSELKE